VNKWDFGEDYSAKTAGQIPRFMQEGLRIQQADIRVHFPLTVHGQLIF
jgi:hypothetical protein